MSRRSALPTLVHRVRHLAHSRPEESAFTWLEDGDLPARGERAETLTFGGLDRAAQRMAAALTARGLRGERALLLYPPGLEFLRAFLGCLYAGVVPVPLSTPRNRKRAGFLAPLALDARPALYLTTAALIDADWSLDLAPLPGLATDRLEEEPLTGETFAPGPEDLAFLQYTSGSTGTPRGVQVTHGNLMADEEMIHRSFATDEDSVFVGWLPLFHDMGLVGNVLHPLYMGIHGVLMAPAAFVQKPVRWLRALSHFEGTTAGGPNFGYELCVQRVQEEQVRELDLSRWNVAYNGAEPVRAQTMERFAEKFAPAGFRREAFLPCYGMAESTLFASGGYQLEPWRELEVDADALEQGHARRPVSREARTARLVSSGRAWCGQDLRVVDAVRHVVLPDRAVGEIWMRGPNVARGYRTLPHDMADPFDARLADGEGPFLRTGDLGFLADGELFVTGRLKDIVIIHGRNLYPQDIELAASGAHPALRLDAAAAFGVDLEDGEGLAIAQEVDRSASLPLRRAGAPGRRMELELRRAIRAEVVAHLDVPVAHVILIPQGGLPRTSSGKVQRRRCRDLWRKGELPLFRTSRLAASPHL